MECVQCEQISKYKCTTCLQPYCSVPCYKVHKATPCTAPPPPPAASSDIPLAPPIEYNFPTADTVPEERLKLLEHSTELRTCLENPHLRKILETLDRCEHPDSMIKHFMQEPLFTEFVDACLKVVDQDEHQDS